MEREPWLLVQEGSKLYLLAKDQKDFVFITVNKALTAEKEEQLARSGSFTKLRLQEQGLTFRVLPGNQVRGVALTGSEAGETLYFYPASGKKLKYVFSDDYEKEQIDAFFDGIERFTAPGKKKKKNDPDAWRTERQDTALYKKFRFVSPALTVLSFGCSIGYIVYHNWPWYLLSLIGPAAAVALDIIFPAYFTLITEKGKKKKAHDLIWPLFAHVLVVMLMPPYSWLDGAMMWKLWIICGVVSAVFMGLLAEEFKRRKEYLLAVLFFVGLFGMMEVGHFNRVFDFAEPEAYVLEVEDLHYSSSRRSDIYQCVVTLPDGSETDIRINQHFYNALEIGDEVRVEIHPGALGIEYATAHPIE